MEASEFGGAEQAGTTVPTETPAWLDDTMETAGRLSQRHAEGHYGNGHHEAEYEGSDEGADPDPGEEENEDGAPFSSLSPQETAERMFGDDGSPDEFPEFDVDSDDYFLNGDSPHPDALRELYNDLNSDDPDVAERARELLLPD